MTNNTALKRTLSALPLIFALLLTFTVPSAALAEEDPIYTGYFNNNAVGGYDVVSYFDGSKPVKGSSEFSLEYMGANWLFTNQQNLALFQADPEKYAPQFGGYCAYAVALGETAKGDPLQYHLDDGKLYLNINAKIKKRWLEDKPGYISKANVNWPTVLQ